jgi:hypothetical protein
VKVTAWLSGVVGAVLLAQGGLHSQSTSPPPRDLDALPFAPRHNAPGLRAVRRQDRSSTH